jgi:hypothetical protein
VTAVAASSALALLASCDPSPAPSDQLSAPAPGNSATPAPAGNGGALNGNYDIAAFESAIQPILDTADLKGCTAAACHGAPAGKGGFALKRAAAPGSRESQANMAAVAARCNPNIPDQSSFYQHATNRHASGSSALVSQQQGITILSWIQHAAPPLTPPDPAPPPVDLDGGVDPGPGGTNPPPGGGNASCISADKFNVGLFTTQIQPMLFGQVDYNAPPGQPIANVGCSRSTCHGTDRGPGTLYLAPTNTPAQNLQSFGCYINAAAPSESPILACPLNGPGCPKSPHPGQNVFRDPTDRNYQRLLSFLYATKTVKNPLDFAFFARQIDPIFKDPNFGGLGPVGGRTCANTSTCHGVNVAGQTPPNLSDLGMLSSATTKDQLLVDYWSAANFANFSTPQGSELFLFPTDLTSDVTQPFATGLHHPGGINFGNDSASAAQSLQAQSVLQWSGGLRPDDQGFQLNWLVAGTYSATQVTQPTTVGDESRLAPQIFDPDGAQQFNNGQWDTLISQSRNVDLNQIFPGNAGNGRVAYAVAYAMNSTAADLQNVLINVTSQNVVLMYVDGRPVAQSNGGGSTVTGIANLPAFSTTHPSTRILLKVLQRPGDAQFGFSLSLKNQSNIPLTNTSGELIFRLDPSGGI